MDLVYILSLSLYFTHTKLVGDGARFSSLLPNSKQISHTSERASERRRIKVYDVENENVAKEALHIDGLCEYIPAE